MGLEKKDRTDQTDRSDLSTGRMLRPSGGYREQLAAARMDYRNNRYPAKQSNMPPAQVCLLCGRPMKQRIARQGKHSGQTFRGCSGYPDGKGTRPFELPQKEEP